MENKLNIQITVDDEQLAQLIKGNIESLPSEKIQEILTAALTELFKSKEGQNLFYKRDYYNSTPQPTDLLVKMIENAISKELLRPCVDEFINTLKDNYVDLIKQTMIATFSNIFFTQMDRSVLQSQISMILNRLEEDNK